MTIRYILMVNKQGQTRIAQYYFHMDIETRTAMEAEIIRKCLGRSEMQCSFMEYQNYKIIYRRYASLFFIVGVDINENELAILEFIHNLVETFDLYFKNVLMFNIDKVHMLLDEMVVNGCIVETNKPNILQAVSLYDL